MKTELQKHLVTLCPSIAIETIWEHDVSPHMEIFDPGNGLDGEDPDGWQCWQSEVRASAIVNGEILTGSDYLGGTWEKYGDNPWESNPEISGYELQQTVTALQDLTVSFKGDTARFETLLAEIAAAVAYIESIE